MVSDADAPVFRAPMRSRDDVVPEGSGVERGLAIGLVGLGGRLAVAPDSLDAAVEAAASEHGERLARRIARFADAPNGAYVWTRDLDANVWLGRIRGPWRYDDRWGAVEADLVHVRDCEWLGEPIDPRRVPAAVTAIFARGGRNWQRIRSLDALPQTECCWSRS
ncbi:GAF domain-containing protein [Pseudoclavibacter endophyticus]|uniref:GAF domain-containing protein n=1 Tax=Pseudoclavibacter endophyticus TaxID=1778590 RepID=UPI001CE4A0E8|nr:GAF domain-containing protein [Pseudoclavibacter endophyticus]